MPDGSASPPSKRGAGFVHHVHPIPFFKSVVDKLSKEPLLNSGQNGGAVVLLRAASVAWRVFAIAVVFRWGLAVLQAKFSLPIPLKLLLAELYADVPWLGTIAAGVYLAFYARFASQWTYLASLYNQIKQAECALTAPTERQLQSLAEWKAAFIEDAKTLHLIGKPAFASIVLVWIEDEAVRSVLEAEPKYQNVVELHRLALNAFPDLAIQIRTSAKS